jgi:hypothetical protein
MSTRGYSTDSGDDARRVKAGSAKFLANIRRPRASIFMRNPPPGPGRKAAVFSIFNGARAPVPPSPAGSSIQWVYDVSSEAEDLPQAMELDEEVERDVEAAE